LGHAAAGWIRKTTVTRAIALSGNNLQRADLAVITLAEGPFRAIRHQSTTARAGAAVPN